MLRTCVLCCAAGGLVGLVVGCSSWSESKPEPGKPAVKAATKDEAVAGYKARLDDEDKKLAELKSKAEKAAGDEKAKLDAKAKDAAAKREAFVKKYDELKAAPADKWEPAKKDADAAFDEFKKAVE